uniref:Uncharacterized protein n=1 Tax=Candidatus Kentrum sp. MB TaxID=2138164 RepID=A0A450Y2G6_9GAMM|nr:MAG: hypothetical protein BECKMB1821G_GA0114241_11364 [Candidatus Kentron sp. MB]VFK35746.1 MAG: hypothetical protein BECKMB1821I_GA0114274_11424 [Candidatus Kentron sp. MB]VFK77472.1 MAG: hypothetical protein BECKMB1821H_GA0114242_11444 [Candidatus Kentron sp. MB]
MTTEAELTEKELRINDRRPRNNSPIIGHDQSCKVRNRLWRIFEIESDEEKERKKLRGRDCRLISNRMLAIIS